MPYLIKAETPASLAAIIGIRKQILKDRMNDLPLQYHKTKKIHPRRHLIFPEDVKKILEYLAPDLLK